MQAVIIGEQQRRLLALCAIRTEQGSVDWSLIAREAQFPGGVDALWRGRLQEVGAVAERSRQVLCRGLEFPEDLFGRVERELAAAAAVGAKLVTVLDPEYPANLRLVANLPRLCSCVATCKSRTRARWRWSEPVIPPTTAWSGPRKWLGCWCSTR